MTGTARGNRAVSGFSAYTADFKIMTITIKCANCGGPAKYDGGPTFAFSCEYCGSTIVVPEELRPAGASSARPQGSPRVGGALNSTQIEEVVRLAAEGQAIQAVKLVREWTGLGLADSKAVVDGLRAGQASGWTSVSMGSSPGMSGTGAAPAVRKGVGCFAILMPLVLTIGIIGTSIYFIAREFPGVDRLFGAGGPIAIPTGFPKLVSPFNRVNLDSSAVTVAGPDRPGAKPDVLVRAFHVDLPEAERYKLTWIDTAKSEPRWRFTTTSSIRFASGGEIVALVEKTRLVALDKTAGTVLWETTLSDQLTGVCDTCLGVVGQRVIALTNDSNVTGYDAKTGRKVWSQRLSSLNRLFYLNEQLLVLDRMAADPFAVQAFVLDQDGKELRKFQISCLQPGQTRPIVGYTYEGYALDTATQSLFTWYGSSNSCLQKYDLSTGKLAWQSLTKARSTQHDAAAMLYADGLIFAGGSNTIIAADASGKVNEQLTDADYELRPLASQNGVLVVRAMRTRGTRRHELWGIDSATGSRLWQVVFDKDGGPLREPNRAAGLLTKDRDSEVWSVGLMPGGLAIVRITAKPALQAIVEIIGLKNGVSAGRKTVPLKAGSLLVSIPTEIEWRGDTVWMALDNSVYAINTKTALIDYQVP